MAKVAINGLGRIGRAALKIILETPELELEAVNDLVANGNLAYLLRYDTAYGRYQKKVESDDSHLTVDGKKIRTFHEKDPSQLPWRELEIDLVFECTGAFAKPEDLVKHVKAGAKHVILSAPAKGDEVATVVHGVNTPDEESPEIISCASCTTNCITPVVEVMGRRVGIKKAVMTTIHAYTSTQGIVDVPNKKMRRGRAGAANFVPTSTGAAKATTKALPQYQGKFDGVAVRAPILVGSLADIIFLTEKATTVEEVNNIFKEESRTDRYQGILGVTEEPLVSSDIIKDPRASVVDLSMTQVVDGDLVKVMSWYDNEWGYASQMIKEALRILK
ncbi:MAG: type I glyceraldehyde-3-phosphate dehydrogenase [Candidatus Aminicenantes bacterium]